MVGGRGRRRGGAGWTFRCGEGGGLGGFCVRVGGGGGWGGGFGFLVGRKGGGLNVVGKLGGYKCGLKNFEL